jgi:hypothetical protein
MQYLSQIALSMILDISQFSYYQTNNLETCTIFQKKYYKDNFKNKRDFLLFIKKYLYASSVNI